MPLTALHLEIAEPDVVGPLAVFPVLGPSCATEFRSFAEAAAQGATVRELSSGAQVGALEVINPLGVAVLLYDGEEVRGAQQDRTLDRSVLVAPGARCVVGVSCVEHGRWDGSRHGEAFAPSPDSAFPELRAAKHRAARARTDGRADQREVWDVVARKSARLGAPSATGAMRDAFVHTGFADEVAGAVTRRDGQLGMVATIAGRVVVADVVGRTDVFAALHGPLVRGYGLDAAEARATDRAARPPAVEDVQAFLTGAVAARADAGGDVAPVGLGRHERFAGPGAEGARLVLDDALITLTAFAPEPARADGIRIRRPSRRR